jgi:hypothetical protein
LDWECWEPRSFYFHPLQASKLMERIELKQSKVLVEDQFIDADLTGQKLVMFMDKSIVMNLMELVKEAAAYCGPLPNLKSEMSKSKTLSFIIFLFISACQNSSEIQHSIEEEIINIDLDQSSGGKLSEYFSGITYTLIENQEANPLVESYQTIVTSNSIFIQDYFNSYVHKFDRKGILQNLFKSTGQGPQEYQQLDHFQVVGDTLFILDRSLRKILGYNSEQQVVYEEFIPVNASIFHKQGDRILFLLHHRTESSTFRLCTGCWGRLDQRISQVAIKQIID